MRLPFLKRYVVYGKVIHHPHQLTGTCSIISRNIPAAVKKTQPDVSSRSTLEIKICVRTYRFFYVTNTEDFLWKYRGKDEMESSFKRLKKSDERRREWMEKLEQGPDIPVAAVGKDPTPPAQKVAIATATESAPPPTVVSSS